MSGVRIQQSLSVFGVVIYERMWIDACSLSNSQAIATASRRDGNERRAKMDQSALTTIVLAWIAGALTIGVLLMNDHLGGIEQSLATIAVHALPQK